MTTGNVSEHHIPLLKAKLPTIDQALPYLHRIDQTRSYVNFGPLSYEFENRLAKHFNVEPKNIITIANGTLAITACLMAFNLPKNSYCIMPSWTFTATPAAACAAGLTPYFVDVNPTTQALDPLTLEKQIKEISHPIGAVIVVSPFGAPINRQAWDDFTKKTGIPVLIDGAAAFETVSSKPEMSPGQTPIMISLHATKIFGIGEGGLILSTNEELIHRIRLISCFGFNEARESAILGMNAKLSEYVAAIGLTVLDNWQEIRQDCLAVRDNYLKIFNHFGIKTWLQNDWVSATCNILLPESAETVSKKLKSLGIDNRRWWGSGCHHHLAYCNYPRQQNLPFTAWLGSSVLSLPFASDLSSEQIERIGDAVESARKIETSISAEELISQ